MAGIQPEAAPVIKASRRNIEASVCVVGSAQ